MIERSAEQIFDLFCTFFMENDILRTQWNILSPSILILIYALYIDWIMQNNTI